MRRVSQQLRQASSTRRSVAYSRVASVYRPLIIQLKNDTGCMQTATITLKFFSRRL